MIKFKLSLLAIVVVGLAYISSFFYFNLWQKNTILTGGDAFGYYAYLPALFIHHDLTHLRYSVYERDKELGVIGDTAKPVAIEEAYTYQNKPVIKYTCGLAILHAPSFFIAHMLAPMFGYAQNGYSSIYMFCVLFGNVLFSLVGLIVLRKILLTFFDENITAIVLVLTGAGTNLFFFSSYNTGMSHGYLFALYAMLMLATIRFHTKQSTLNALFLGATAGLITLIRPNEVYCLLIPVLYGISGFRALIDKAKFFLRKKTFYLTVLIFLVCIIPQLFYWYLLTGKLVFYSYGSEGFNFLHPKIIDGLFGFKNGWFAYTPVMILACVGLLFFAFKNNKFGLPIVAVLPLHMFVIYSWWCWFYMGGLGSRPMIELYPLMSIPLGYLISGIKDWVAGKVFIACCVVFFPLQQATFNYQRWANIMWSEDSTPTYYWETFFKTRIGIAEVIAYDTNEKQPENPIYSHLIMERKLCEQVAGAETSCCFFLDKLTNRTPEMVFSVAESGATSEDWIKTSFYCCNCVPPATLYEHASIVIEFRRGNKVIKSKWIRIQNKLSADGMFGIWKSDCPASGEVFFYTRVPKDVAPNDVIVIYGFNNSGKPVGLKNIKAELWKS